MLYIPYRIWSWICSIFCIVDSGSIDTTTEITDGKCPPDKLLENKCEMWARYGMCGGTFIAQNCPTSCTSCWDMLNIAKIIKCYIGRIHHVSWSRNTPDWHIIVLIQRRQINEAKRHIKIMFFYPIFSFWIIR